MTLVPQQAAMPMTAKHETAFSCTKYYSIRNNYCFVNTSKGKNNKRREITHSFFRHAHFLVKCSTWSLLALSSCLIFVTSSDFFSLSSFSRASASLLLVGIGGQISWLNCNLVVYFQSVACFCIRKFILSIVV